MSTAEIRPARPRCGHRANPLGTEEKSPRLSWVLEADGRDKKQSAYQVLVAGSEEDLAADRGTFWDSGKVDSDRSVNVLEPEGRKMRLRVEAPRGMSIETRIPEGYEGSVECTPVQEPPARRTPKGTVGGEVRERA